MKKLSWVINRIVEKFGLKNETFALLAAVYAEAGEMVRTELLDQENGNESGRRGLRTIRILQSPFLATQARAGLHSGHGGEAWFRFSNGIQKWKMREHPDFNSWVSGGAGTSRHPDSPVESFPN